MPRNEGNAHGRHYDEQDHEADANRNYNEDSGRRHFATDTEQHAGGHSDRWTDTYDDNARGEAHELADDSHEADEHRNAQPQDAGRMQGEARNEGGHQGGRNQHNSR